MQRSLYSIPVAGRTIVTLSEKGCLFSASTYKDIIAWLPALDIDKTKEDAALSIVTHPVDNSTRNTLVLICVSTAD